MQNLYEFFNKLKSENLCRYFLMNKFYYNYKDILYKKEDTYDVEIVKKYMFNNDFLELILIIFETEDEILEDFDYDDLNLLKSIIEDAYEITRNEIENEHTYKDILKHFKYRVKYSELFKNQKEEIENYDLDLSYDCIRLLEEEINIRYDHNVKPFKSAEEVINKVKNDNPLSDTYILNIYDYESTVILFSLVCNNYFLDIIEYILIEKNMKVKTINNIINILNTSINLYFNNIDSTFERYAIESLDNIKDFNVAKAKELINKLTFKKKCIKKNTKVIKFDYLA